jgi:hypothetical protein
MSVKIAPVNFGRVERLIAHGSILGIDQRHEASRKARTLDVLTIGTGVACVPAAVMPELFIGMRLARPARSIASVAWGHR